MPGLELQRLSCNWKSLQARLQAEKKHEPKENELKRKRSGGKANGVNGFKKIKFSNTKTDRSRKALMTSNEPSRDEERSSEVPRMSLAKELGLSSEDISTAYDTPTDGPGKFDDAVNGGLHPAHKLGKYVGMDCEMVGTGPPPHDDNVLARVSLVNFHGEQIYDSYVLPPPGIKIEDYRTFVSGIKPTHLLKGYARPLAEVQKDVAKLLDGRVLVGHALWNDFQVLLMSHPKRDIRDTSRHPKFRIDSKGRPPALRHLAKSELGMVIQTGEHSSIEDARAAMMLFKKEKAGFEEENRKRFGRQVKVVSKTASKDTRKGRANALETSDYIDGEDVESGDEGDADLLDGEELDEVLEGKTTIDRVPRVTATKKRKTKKRTKRK